MKMKNRVLIIAALTLLTAVILFTYRNWPSGKEAASVSGPVQEQKPVQKQEASDKQQETKNKQQEQLPAPQIFLSSNILEQGDTLLIKIESPEKTAGIKGSFSGKEIYFFRLGNFLASIVGISTKKEPGNYELFIDFPDGGRFKKEIEVKKNDWRVKTLRVTKELEEKGLTQPKIIENLATKEGPLVKETVSQFTPIAYFGKPFIYPLKKIIDVGPFGDIRESPSGSLQHLGVDLDADEGTPVFSINDGVIVFVKDLPTYGKTIIIDHGLGIFSLYLHLDKFKTTEGQKVKQGDIVGLSGNTGYSIGPHLHFSIKANGSSVNPLRFIETIAKGL